MSEKNYNSCIFKTQNYTHCPYADRISDGEEIRMWFSRYYSEKQTFDLNAKVRVKRKGNQWSQIRLPKIETPYQHEYNTLMALHKCKLNEKNMDVCMV